LPSRFFQSRWLNFLLKGFPNGVVQKNHFAGEVVNYLFQGAKTESVSFYSFIQTLLFVKEQKLEVNLPNKTRNINE